MLFGPGTSSLALAAVLYGAIAVAVRGWRDALAPRATSQVGVWRSKRDVAGPRHQIPACVIAVQRL
jgi:hypothetical protein